MSTAESSSAVGIQQANVLEKKSCKDWQKTGNCRDWKKCKSSHEAKDKGILRRLKTNNSKKQPAQTNATPSGSKHPASSVTPSATAKKPPSVPTQGTSGNRRNENKAFDVSNFPVKLKRCPRNWQPGGCNEGDNCRYSHDNEISPVEAHPNGAPGSADGSKPQQVNQQRRLRDAPTTQSPKAATEAKASREEDDAREEALDRQVKEFVAKARAEEEMRQEQVRHALQQAIEESTREREQQAQAEREANERAQKEEQERQQAEKRVQDQQRRRAEAREAVLERQRQVALEEELETGQVDNLESKAKEEQTRHEREAQQATENAAREEQRRRREQARAEGRQRAMQQKQQTEMEGEQQQKHQEEVLRELEKQQAIAKAAGELEQQKLQRQARHEAQERAKREKQERAREEQRRRAEAQKAELARQERLQAEMRTRKIEEERLREEEAQKAELERKRVELEKQQEAERLERERLAREAREEQMRREEVERVELERKRLELERQWAELERKRLELERQQEAERLEKERVERERLAREAREEKKRKEEARRAELERQRVERERLAREKREEKKRKEEARRRAELERQREAERVERERLAKEAREEAQRQRKIQLEAKWREEATIIEQYVVLDSSLVTCGAGFDIRHIITGFDLCRITIKNLPKNASRNEIINIFVQHGVPREEFFLYQVRDVGNKLEGVVLASTEQGQTLVAGLKGIKLRSETLTFEVSDNASWNAMGTAARGRPFLTVNWKIPADTIIATYSSTEEARAHAKKLDAKTWKGHQIRATLDHHQRRDRFQGVVVNESTAVRIVNCPASLNVQVDPEFRSFACTSNLRALRSMPYNHQNTLDLVQQHLFSQNGVLMDAYEVLAIEEATGEQKVKAHFDDWEDVMMAHNSIDRKKLGFGITTPYLRSWHPKPLQYSIRIPRRQYLAQKKQWDGLSEKKPGSDAHIHIRAGDKEDTFIRVLGNDKKVAGAVKVKVESMVAGETLGSTYWHPSFMASRMTKALFDRIHAATKAHIRSDFKSRSLKVYGEPEVLEDVRRMIKEEVDRLANMETTRMLDRGLVGFFMREGWGRLKELLGEENVNLNLASRPCKITIKGGEEARHHLQRVIDEARAHSSLGGAQVAVEGETCPICYDNASHPEQLGCGHTYCSGCLKHFLTSAADTKTFPLACMGNDATCNVPISIPFIRRFLPAQAFQQLVEVAFNCYLEQHPHEMKYCTTPDCKQIYRRQTNKAMLQCPSCFSTICPACDEEAHKGLTCAERRLYSDPAEQERLTEEAAAANGYKKCPQCSILIEKTEGCNHMTCNCGAHICWRCMGVFTHEDIYDHMRDVHGNIYDDVPAGVAPGGVPDRELLEEQINAFAQIERERLLQEAAAREYEEYMRALREEQVAEIRRQEIAAAAARRQADALAQAERERVAQEEMERMRRMRDAEEERQRAREEQEIRQRQEAERRRQANCIATYNQRLQEEEALAARRRTILTQIQSEISYRVQETRDQNTRAEASPLHQGLLQVEEEKKDWCVVM